MWLSIFRRVQPSPGTGSPPAAPGSAPAGARGGGHPLGPRGGAPPGRGGGLPAQPSARAGSGTPANRPTIPSIRAARSRSRAVSPPLAWVVRTRRPLRQRMSMFGWWSAASASSATRPTNAIAAGKVGKRRSRTMASPSRPHCSRRASPATISASSRRGAYGIGGGAVRSRLYPSLEVGEELGAGAVTGLHQAVQRGGRDQRLLAHAAHDHAQVRRLDDHPPALGVEPIFDEVGDLLGHALLDLEPPCEHLDDARQLREADHLVARDVRHGRLAEEREEVVLAERVELDVLDDHHLGVLDLEDGAVEESIRIDVVTGQELAVHPVDATGGLEQPRAVRILADLAQDLADGLLDPAIARDDDHFRRLAESRAVGPGAEGLADLGLDLPDDSVERRRQSYRHGTPWSGTMVPLARRRGARARRGRGCRQRRLRCPGARPPRAARTSAPVPRAGPAPSPTVTWGPSRCGRGAPEPEPPRRGRRAARSRAPRPRHHRRGTPGGARDSG